MWCFGCGPVEYMTKSALQQIAFKYLESKTNMLRALKHLKVWGNAEAFHIAFWLHFMILLYPLLVDKGVSGEWKG